MLKTGLFKLWMALMLVGGVAQLFQWVRYERKLRFYLENEQYSDAPSDGSEISNELPVNVSRANVSASTIVVRTNLRPAIVNTPAESIPSASTKAVDIPPQQVAAANSASENTPPESAAVRTSNMPSWLVEYRQWHTEQRASLNATNWKNSQEYLIMHCSQDNPCGGASDRLQYVPLAMRIASQYNRILLIHWERPYALEEFLVPPTDGIDWRVPEYMLEMPVCANAPFIKSGKSIHPILNDGKRVVCMQYQIWDHGMIPYDEIAKEKNETSFDDVYRDLWNLVFQPSSPVQNLLEAKLKGLDLHPAAYVATHVRALYKKDKSNNLGLVENAVRCASSLKPNSSDTPIFMASDSDKVLRHAVAYGKANNRTVVARTEDPAPLHLDRGGVFLANTKDWNNFTVADYYDVFVDLYLLASAECTAFHIGGYGRWGRLLSYNPACYVRHDHNKNCAWGGEEAAPEKEKKEMPIEKGVASNDKNATEPAGNKNIGHDTPSTAKEGVSFNNKTARPDIVKSS
jgi:hypothetical protein